MTVGQCGLSNIPIRAEAKSSAEMVSQLIYGEYYDVIKKQKDWLYVESKYDQYKGWISENQFQPIFINSLQPSFQNELIRHRVDIITSMGSMVENKVSFHAATLSQLAIKWLNVPYLWGGRTAFGVDCSGFIQIIHKCLGIKLPRDAWQQAELGEVISFEEHKAEDLAFFSNKNGKITHVGLIIEPRKIIHASGKVRIDRLDNKGIMVESDAAYSHFNPVIVRL